MRVKLEDVCERGSSNIKQSDIIKMSGNYEKIIDDILKIQDEELKVFLVDEMKSKENEYDLAKKLKLKHKNFENVIELEDFVNKRIINKSNIINIQYIQNGFTGYYVLFYFK